MGRVTFSDDDLRARRLGRHALTGPPAEPTPAGVVAAMHGAHAQVMSAAELSVGLRLPGCTRTTVRAALWGDRTLTKTWGPRGTVHLVPTRDLPLWTGALASVPRTRSRFAPDVRLTPARETEVVAAVGDAVEEGELTIDELDAAVVERTGSWAGDLVMPAFQGLWPRWRQAIAVAADRGVVVFGADRGRKVTYTSPRRADPSFTPAEPSVAVPAFLHRYLAAYGPATPAQLARWMAAPLGWSSEVFTAAGPAIEGVVVDGQEAWVNAGDTDRAAPIPHVALLPYFDALSVGFVPRETLFPGRAADRALARGQAGNFPVLLVDGVVQGVWHHRRRSATVHLTVETWADLTPARRRLLDEQVDRVGHVLEAVPDLTIGPVSVGPHA